MVRLASVHGTKQPTCARRAIQPIVRMYVDLPPMFGPVMIKKRELSRLSSTSFVMKEISSWHSIHGWRASLSIVSPVPRACILGRRVLVVK
jgi:hypothetical protein